MFQEQGQGAFGPGFSAPHQDRRVVDLILDNLGDGYNRKSYKTPSDVLRNFVLQRSGFGGGDTPLSIGSVVYSFPSLGWYRVQLNRGGGSVPCCMLSHANTGPLGVRSGGAIGPYSFVVVYKPADVEWGIILGVLPPLMCDPRVLVPGWVSQGSQSGVKREEAYKEPQKMTYKDGGIQDFGAMAPMDSTALDWNRLAETGVGVHVDPAMAFLRASDMCGMWVTIFDNYMRLAAMNFDFQAVAHHQVSKLDEGETRYEDRYATYPWEATGQYTNTPFGREWDDGDVQFQKPVGKIDLTEEERKLQGVFRASRYAGYLGQGWFRQVVRPAKESGKRLFTDTEGDIGLFRESIGLDGAAMWESAKGLYLVKRPRIVVAKETKPPEHKDGDDKEAGNYKFSSQFGGGEDHKVGDVEVPGEPKSMLRVAAVLDVLSHHWNWKALHPFHYHRADYRTEQETETQKFDRVADHLDFSPLADGDLMADPSPKAIKIDHRYNEVDYYQRIAYLAFFEDGSVALGSGCGGQIALAGGNATVESAGEVRLRGGTRTLLMSRDVIVRGHGSVDISSAKKEVRLAAHKKVQILGNSVLIHGKGKSKQYEYKNQIGEDVKSAGVLIKTNSEFVALADDVYIRSGIPKDAGGGYATDGGGGGSGGDIVLDAKKKGKDVVLRGKNVHCLVEDALTVWHGPEGGTPDQTHQFRDTIAMHSTNLIVRGQIVGCGKSGLLIDGSIAATGSIACARYMAHKKGPFVGTVPGSFAGQIKQVCDAAKQGVETVIPIGAIIENLQVNQKWTEPANRPGNDDMIRNIQFSFRDDQSGQQYKAGSLKFFEARWETLARLGMASGVQPWSEDALEYQGYRLRAFPGEKKWTDGQTFHRPGTHTMFMVGSGNSTARPGPYEDAKLPEWDRTSLEAGAKIVG